MRVLGGYQPHQMPSIDDTLAALGNEPPLVVGGREKPPDRREVSIRWLSGTFLTAVTSSVLMGVALFAALDGREVLATPPEILSTSALGRTADSQAGAKGGRLVPTRNLASLADRRRMELATMRRSGDRDVLRTLPFVQARMSLAAGHATNRSYPSFDGLEIFAEEGAPQYASTTGIIYGAGVENVVRLRMSEFPLEMGAFDEGSALSAEEVEVVVRSLGAILTVGEVRVAALHYVDPQRFGDPPASSALQPSSGIRIVAENASVANRARADDPVTDYAEDVIPFHAEGEIAEALERAGYASPDAEGMATALTTVLGSSTLAAGSILRLGVETRRGVSRIVRASLRLSFIRSFAEFREALADWDLPATHFVYAGLDGDIGIVTAGRFPIRAAGHTGQFPADGTRSDAAWQGFLETPDLPSLRNPQSGMIASGNNPVVPPQWFEALREARGLEGEVDFLIDAARGYRGGRITQRLLEDRPHDRETLSAIQSDVTTPEIASALTMLDGVSVSADSAACLNVLTRWDGSHVRESAGALAFAYFWEAMLAEIYRPRLPAGVPAQPGMTELLSLEIIMADRTSGWWDDPRTDAVETRDDRLSGLVEAACGELRARHGEAPARWRWDSAYHAPFRNPILGESGIGLLERIGNRTVAVSGGAATVSIGRYRRNNDGFAMVHLPSYRYVMDLGAPLRALSANSTGQSMHPLSPHYADQMAGWAERVYVEVDLSDQGVRARARSRMLLRPVSP